MIAPETFSSMGVANEDAPPTVRPTRSVVSVLAAPAAGTASVPVSAAAHSSAEKKRFIFCSTPVRNHVYFAAFY